MLAWVILLLSYFGNIFNVGYGDGWFVGFQRDSASIVEKTAECKDVLDYNQPLIPAKGYDYISTMESGNCEKQKVQPYASQYGLQARVIAFFAPNNDAELPSYFKKVEFILASVIALVLAIFVAKIYRMYGTITAVVLTSLLALSPWIAGYARNMYWIAFLMFLPFVLSFIIYPYLSTVRKKALFFTVIGVLIFLKSLDGYEHITTVGISVFAAVAYWEIVKHSKRLQDLWPQLVIIGMTTVAALALAIAVNIIDLHSYFHSWDKASHAVLSRAGDRATGIKAVQPNVIGGFEVTDQEIYKFVDKFYDLDQLKSGDGHPLKYALISALNYMTLPAVSLPISLAQPLQAILQSIAAVAVFGYVCIRKIGRVNKGLREMYIIGVVGAASWLVLMPAHAYPHAHLNGIIFYIPLLIVCYVAIGIWLQQHLLHLRKKIYGKK
jgi:hypothetical protein